jgi:methylmalonyl-CoA mutase C-terminal domain/subunit
MYEDEGSRAHPIRVMLAKVGLDGHDRGVRVVARTLRDAGMEVIYTGLHRTPDQVVEAAVQEDVDVLGVSILSGAHLGIFTRIFQRLGQLPSQHRFVVVAGGVMSDEDVEELKRMGVADVIGQDAPPDLIVSRIRELVSAHAASR